MGDLDAFRRSRGSRGVRQVGDIGRSQWSDTVIVGNRPARGIGFPLGRGIVENHMVYLAREPPAEGIDRNRHGCTAVGDHVVDPLRRILRGQLDKRGPGFRYRPRRHDRFDRAAQHDGHSRVRATPQSYQMPGQPGGSGVQLAICHRLPGRGNRTRTSITERALTQHLRKQPGFDPAGPPHRQQRRPFRYFDQRQSADRTFRSPGEELVQEHEEPVVVTGEFPRAVGIRIPLEVDVRTALLARARVDIDEEVGGRA